MTTKDTITAKPMNTESSITVIEAYARLSKKIVADATNRPESKRPAGGTSGQHERCFLDSKIAASTLRAVYRVWDAAL